MNKIMILVLLVSTTACLYQPDQENFVDIQLPNFSRYRVDVALEAGNFPDSVELYMPTTFTVRSTGQSILALHYTIDDEAPRTLFVAEGLTPDFLSFEFDPDDFEQGNHKLSLWTDVKSGTNSLADNLGVEFVSFKDSTILVVDKIAPAQLDSITIAPVDGQLRLSWEPPAKNNFIHYQLEKNYRAQSSGGGFWSYEETVDLGKDTTFYVDESYIGEGVTYKVNVVGYNYLQPGKRVNYFLDPLQVAFEYQNDSLFMNYTTELYDVDNMEVFANPFRLSELRNTGFEAAGRLLVDPEHFFGHESTVTISIGLETRNLSNYQLAGRSFTNFQGQRIAPHRTVRYNPVLGQYALINEGELFPNPSHIIRYDEAFNQLDSTGYPWGSIKFSEDGNYAYYGEGHTLNRLNIWTGELMDPIDLSDVTGATQAGTRLQGNTSRIANNHLYCFPDLNNNTQIVDLNDQTLIGLDSSSRYGVLSASGRHYISNFKVYDVENDFVFKGWLGDSLEFIFQDFTLFEFNAEYELVAFAMFNGITRERELRVVDLNDMEIILSRRETPSSQFTPAFDPISNRLRVIYRLRGVELFQVYEMPSAELIASERIRSNRTTVLVNNLMINQNGFYQEIF